MSQRLIAGTIDAKSADFQSPASIGGKPTLLTLLFWPPPDRMSDGDLAGTGMDLV